MAETAARHKFAVHALARDSFAPYGQVVLTRRSGNQFDPLSYLASDNPEEAQLVLNKGMPRLWIMHQFQRGRRFQQIARHCRVTQCLGSLEGKAWLIAVAPAQEFENARPPIEDVVGFHIPGDAIIKLHIATWHAGPHFDHDECKFINLENMDTRENDFHSVDLGVECELVG